MQSNINEMMPDLLNSFKKDNVILYVGRNGRKELTPEICGLPWSCMVTSCTDDIGKEFASQKKDVVRYTSYRTLPSQLFVKNRFSVIQMYGSESVVDESLEEYEDEFLRREVIRKDAERIFDYVMMRMDMRTRMVIIGYAPEDPDEFPVSGIIIASRNMRGGVIDIYGSSNEAMIEPLVKSLAKRGGQYTAQKLGDLIRDISDQDEEYQEVDRKQVNIFYKGRVPVSISGNDLLEYSQSIRLLTEELLYQVRPYGRVEQQEWFRNFLDHSSEEPQWYGYLRQSEFYLKRDYEDKFIALVRNLLEGGNMKREPDIPVILQGPPGTSKSIELAALAVRIFEEHINPVIFINSDRLSFSENSTEMEELDTLMQTVEGIGDKDTKFLVLWDSSSYKAIGVNAANMLRALKNRGRRVVLVCTAYGPDSRAKSVSEEAEQLSGYYYKPDKHAFVKSGTQAGDVLCDNKFYYVHADGRVNDKEHYQLDSKLKLYAVLPADERKAFWEKVKEEETIFNIFYHLRETLRPKLNETLSKEQELVQRFVNRVLGAIDQTQETERVKDNALLRALQKAGIEISEEDKRKLGEEEEETLDSEFDPDRFAQVIAMFGRFKLDTPFSLAVRSIYRNPEKYRDYMDTYYGNNSRRLFELLTTDIPFIHYSEDENGKHVFRYRSPLEAELFLNRNNIDPDRQTELICDAIDYYAESYRELGEEDDELKSAIEKILRMIGPNTDCVDIEEHEHRMFLSNMEKLIQKLTALRREEIPDTNSGFAAIEITFVREYYGKLWDRLKGGAANEAAGEKPWERNPDAYNADTYITRIKRLKNAGTLALRNIDELQKQIITKSPYERKYLSEQMNSLSVEACLCSDSLRTIWKDYEMYCREMDIPVALDKNSYSPIRYRRQYEMLVKATLISPLNGYAYNALFNAFEKEYEVSGEERRILLLSEIKLIADEAVDYPIVNRGMNGRDEISMHISRIAEYASKVDVTIDSILAEERSPFLELYKKLLEQGNAAAICFVCQRELDNAGLGGSVHGRRKHDAEEYILTEHQLEVCKKIMDFMTGEEYYSDCISGNSYALYLLLRVEWMLFNRRLLSATNEYQKTYADKEQWTQINRVCVDYLACAGANTRPIVVLIYALSELHLTRDYKHAYELVHRMNQTDFIATPRMRVPYLICFEPGKPEVYSGTVLSQKNYNGYIQCDQLPNRLGSDVGVRFYMKNMGWKTMPINGTIVDRMTLGLGFTGFAAYQYNEEGGTE